MLRKICLLTSIVLVESSMVEFYANTQQRQSTRVAMSLIRRASNVSAMPQATLETALTFESGGTTFHC